MKVLIVDDDLALADIVSFTMRRAGYDVFTAYDGQQALECWQSQHPDLIILDLNLPRVDGFTVCKWLRSRTDTPIIILSVRDAEEDILHGLEYGADDYMIKPFSPRQLVARAEAVLRRANSIHDCPDSITVGNLTLESSRNELYRAGKAIAQLTHLECRLLEIMMRNAGQVLPTEILIDYVWGPACGDRTMLKQLVYRLRHKIELNMPENNWIETVAGIGYSFSSKIREVTAD